MIPPNGDSVARRPRRCVACLAGWHHPTRAR